MSYNPFLKTYWLFGYNEYYPSGGLMDVIETFDTLDDAISFYEDFNYNFDVAYVFNKDTNYLHDLINK